MIALFAVLGAFIILTGRREIADPRKYSGDNTVFVYLLGWVELVGAVGIATLGWAAGHYGVLGEVGLWIFLCGVAGSVAFFDIESAHNKRAARRCQQRRERRGTVELEHSTTSGEE
jgi:hypothetical protein